MKRMLSILLAAMLLCVAMAPLATAGAEQEPVTLRVTWWGSQTRHDLTMAAIEKFEEKYPYITVEAEFTSWDGYWSKLATQVAGGLMPDVIQMDYQYLNQYAQSGVLADLTPFFESGAIDVSNVAQSVIDSGAVNGTVYALSTGTNALATFYRKDVLDEAGSRAHLQSAREPEELRAMKTALSDAKRERREAVEALVYEKAASARMREIALRSKLGESRAEWKRSLESNPVEITAGHIQEVITAMTGIPAERVSDGEMIRLQTLREHLAKRVVGQQEAVERIAIREDSRQNS